MAGALRCWVGWLILRGTKMLGGDCGYDAGGHWGGMILGGAQRCWKVISGIMLEGIRGG